MSSGSGSSSSSRNVRVALVFLVAAMFIVIGACCGVYALVSSLINGEESPPPEMELASALTVAYSPEKEEAFSSLVDNFNALGLKTTDGEEMVVRTVSLDPESMMNHVLDGSAAFQAITPDSSVWLGQLDRTWSAQLADEDATVVGETVRYAVSPVAITMWEGVARDMGWPDRAIGWEDLLTRAQTDPDFRWSHPSTNSASGLLATLAAFYAGAGKTRGLTIDDVTDQNTLD